MKKKYMKPDILLVKVEACSICQGSPRWIVDGGGADDEGEINPDDDDYDPSNPNNW